MLRVKAIQGEPTRFHVESCHLVCVNPECKSQVRKYPELAVEFTLRQKTFLQHCGLLGRVEKALALVLEKNGFPKAGQQCSRCGAALVDREHLVDISGYSYNGQCSCEYFMFAMEPELRRIPPARQGLGLHRCQHIDCARSFALDVAIHAHQAAQGEARGGGKDF